jgi:hypothetical protein
MRRLPARVHDARQIVVGGGGGARVGNDFSISHSAFRTQHFRIQHLALFGICHLAFQVKVLP